MRKNILAVPILLAMLLITTSQQSLVQAHSVGGSVEKVVGEYLIDIGYSELTLTTNKSIRFDFDLLINETKERVSFTDVWVRIMKENQLMFAGSIKKADIGLLTTMSYIFQKDGEYELTTRFQNEGETLSETSFLLTVEKDEETSAQSSRSSANLLLIGFIGLVIGFVLCYFVRRKTQPLEKNG